MRPSAFAVLAVAALVFATAVIPAEGACKPGCDENLPGDVASGWERGFSKSRRQNFKTYGYRIVAASAGHPVRAGGRSIRFEVRPGDCGWDDAKDSRRSDCASDRERHELSQRSRMRSGEWWFGWSIFLPKDYVNVFPTKTALGQFHQREGRVVWMFQNYGGGYWVDNQVAGRTTEIKKIVSDKAMRGRWTDIAGHAKWTDDGGGFCRVYMNGAAKPAYAWTGPTTQGKQVYFKFGVYRSFMSRWRKANGRREVPRQVVYFDEVRRGTKRADVRPRR